MKPFLLALLCFLFLQEGFAQKRYFTKTATVSFEAGTALEDIDAINKSGTCVFDLASGQLEMAVLIKGFEFKRALMQEHFNENYLESDQYPKAVFKGTMAHPELLTLQKDGTYPVSVTGILDLHGVKKSITVNAQIVVNKGQVSATAAFSVTLADYKINIPGLVKDKISKTASIKVSGQFTALK